MRWYQVEEELKERIEELLIERVEESEEPIEPWCLVDYVVEESGASKNDVRTVLRRILHRKRGERPIVYCFNGKLKENK